MALQDFTVAEEKSIKAKLDRLEKELAILKQGPFGPASEFMQALPKDEREQLLKALEDEGAGLGEDVDLVSDEELESIAQEAEEVDTPAGGSPSPFKVTLRVPSKEKAYVKRFNLALKEADGAGDDPRPYLRLWKWYLRCQQKVANFSLILPEDVWRFLWESQSKLYYRPQYLLMLANDMKSAGTKLDDTQWIEYIKALQANGDVATAVEMWEKQRPSLGSKPNVAADFWTTGVKLYVALGRPHKAQDLAFECYDHSTAMSPEVLALVVQAWAQSSSPSAPEKAWTCYLELRRRLASKSALSAGAAESENERERLHLLDMLSNVFLRAGRKDLALAVFKDMVMLKSKSPTDSWTIYKDMVPQTGDSTATHIQEDSINRIGLSVLASLPKSFQNKYFFAAWLKWLIGASKLQDAVLVVELMYERAIKPDARHLNGLVAAFLRQGSRKDHDQAEKLAWTMIDSRVNLVRSRTSTTKSMATTPADRPLDGSSQSKAVTRIPIFLRRDAPAATIETFSILLQYYVRRGEAVKAERLTEIMTGPAQLKPNSFIMNHWLYAALRSGDLAGVWSRYQALKKDIQPDLETFAALWDSAKASLGKPLKPTNKFPSPRALFGEMQTWLAQLDPRKRNQAEEAFSHDLYEQIIRCFCLASDLRGVLCALHGLNRSFKALPHENISEMIIMQVARSSPSDLVSNTRPRKGFLLSKRRLAQYRGAVGSLAEIMGALTERKQQEYIERGVESAQLEDSEGPTAQELRLDVLTSFICMVLERQLKDKGNLFNEVEQVATVMMTEIPDTIKVATQLRTRPRKIEPAPSEGN